jgi:ferrous iron transport protein B
VSCPACEAAPSTGELAAASVLLVGNPNVGKSTLFNALTGARQRAVNAPGTTLEIAVGTWNIAGVKVGVADLPGAFSLDARSLEEKAVAEALADAEHGTVALVVLDATALPRSLYLLAQVADSGRPVIGALTMVDIARDRGLAVNVADLAAATGLPVIAVDPRRRSGLDALAGAVTAALEEPMAMPHPRRSEGAVEADVERWFAWVEAVTEAMPPQTPRRITATDRIDRVMLHPWVGVPVFLLVMWGLFELSTRVAGPLISAIASFAGGPVADWVSSALGRLGVGGGWFEGLMVDGILTGLGVVLSFLPLLALVFAALGILDGSGYLARAAVVADRAMRVIGLDGRAVLPLMIGFGCNVPAIEATRVLPRARQRLVAGLLVPYTSCSARLPVYLLLAAAFFPRHAGTVIFGLYVASVLLVAVGGLAFRRILGDAAPAERESLVLVLPPYQLPDMRTLWHSIVARLRGFVSEAGRVIVIALVVMWALAAIPVRGGHEIAEVPIADSAFGVGAQALAPVLAPLGLGDWHIAAALASGFVAKEVAVGALAESYAVDGGGDNGTTGGLSDRLRGTLTETSGGHPRAAALAFMVFVLAYTPCLATVSQMRRSLGRRWTMIGVGVQLAVAWVLGTLVFQVGRLL